MTLFHCCGHWPTVILQNESDHRRGELDEISFGVPRSTASNNDLEHQINCYKSTGVYCIVFFSFAGELDGVTVGIV